MRFKAAVAVALLFAAGCGLAEKRARELLEQESFEEAVVAYEKVVASNPENLEARAALKKARQGVIGKRLIDVRKARQAGQPLSASDQLVQVLAQERAWDVRPAGAAVGTEDEELEAATKFLVGAMETQVKRNQPVATESFFKRYETLFEVRGKKAFLQLQATAKKQGASLCSSLSQARLSGRPEYRAFLGRLCGHYGQETGGTGSERDLEAKRIGTVALDGKIEGLDPRGHERLVSAFNQSLRTLPAYSPKGVKIPTDISGSYQYQHHKVPTQLLHTYYVDEQYVTTERVRKSRIQTVQMPGGALAQQEVTVEEEVPVTRSRRVAREFPYGAWRISQSGTLDGSAVSKWGDLRVAHSATLSEAGDQNDISNPMIGLRPFAPTLTEQTVWQNREFEAWAAKFRDAVLAALRAERCRESESGPESPDHSEAVQSCLLVAREAPPSHVDAWYVARFGIGRVDFEKVIAP